LIEMTAPWAFQGRRIDARSALPASSRLSLASADFGTITWKAVTWRDHTIPRPAGRFVAEGCSLAGRTTGLPSKRADASQARFSTVTGR